MKLSKQKCLTDSTAKGLRTLFIVIATVIGLGVSAVAGALVQSQLNSRPTLSIEQEKILSEQVSRDSAYVRETMNQLAARVGDLQAKLIQMDSLSKRVAETAGVSYTDPEVMAAMASAAQDDNDLFASAPVDWNAEGLGRKLDSLASQLSNQQDWVAMLDMVMAKRAGSEAVVPTIHPVDAGYSSSSFGWRRHPLTGRHTLHEGMDFAAPVGTPIAAASGGIVTEARYVPGYGKLVEINHGSGLVTRYAHASSINVRLGDVVEKGQLVARVGNTGRTTGAHLHFEVRMAGQPVDPALFLPRSTDSESMLAHSDVAESSD
ncbi:M23 family metallopeptidase [Paenalcaligenes niemegkensis]|uniref:M23 family metallopeptidase n=1 Tax=Paenalcaligenes niemegkensis TaxID=2895469 RepID=UPI001EE95A9C|nr:M23 family metallopeptidase [Paenalcaligenes niemegkensis]MCQ9615898.1 M23 family metallopeptidase [Paenalcaligenes niemegkensis]